MDFSVLLTSESLISLVILIVLEVVLGIDNVIFVSIIMNRMNEKDEKKARTFWIAMGMSLRILLLIGLSWLLAQKGKALFTIPYLEKGIDLASLVMLVGGLFLIYKTVKEIHHKLEGETEIQSSGAKKLSFAAGLSQIILIDMIFSFDSIITAGGTAKHIEVMVIAVVFAMMIMFFFSPNISSFIHKHPTLKMLALSFLVMIGFVLLVEGWSGEAAHELHLKNYVYFAMAFSVGVEALNMAIRRKASKRVHIELNEPVLPKEQEYNDQAR
jgi:predicted tellurium resistance membrane protein TerC